MTPRPAVVRQIASVVTRILDGDPRAREEWADRCSWATLAEARAGLDAALEGVHELLAEHDRLRQADIDSGLDDWAFAARHGIKWDA